MLQTAISRICRARHFMQLSKSYYIRGHWPEPITQQTLNQFLKDINYFEEPTKFENIGVPKSDVRAKSSADVATNTARKTVTTRTDTEAVEILESDSVGDLDEVLSRLSKEPEIPELNYDDVRIQGDQLKDLAITYGIYRDLFGTYKPDREYIKFTQEQADKLNKLVPYYWITDQPFARVQRKQKETTPLKYFDPVVGISARFVRQDPNQEDEISAHTSFYGNIIPAAEAIGKPSITLDGKLISDIEEGQALRESEFNNWVPGAVSCCNFNNSSNLFYTVALLNLDYLHEDAANLHWMIANIAPSNSGDQSTYDELCEYLPVHGVNGFGYSRYVFVVFQHKSKLDSSAPIARDFSLENRKFSAEKFIVDNKSSGVVPVGLSWFQTSWDDSSNGVFHKYLDMKSPCYEHVQTKYLDRENTQYPGRVPFNIFLDHLREKKKINEQVLLDRLKSVNPFDYKDQYVPPDIPQTIHEERHLPSWMRISLFKKKNKIGYWRGLRPASATIPLDNNADLDYPLRPLPTSNESPLGVPNLYEGNKRRRIYKKSLLDRPPHEHEAVFVQEGHEYHAEEVKKRYNLR